MRVDVVVAFFVRVLPTVEGIANAAQTLGQRTIDSIRIMQVDGLKAGGNSAAAAEVPGGGNLAEQAVGAALRYRAHAPVLDKLLQEVGLAEPGLAGLVAAAHPAGQARTNSGTPEAPAPGPAAGSATQHAPAISFSTKLGQS